MKTLYDTDLEVGLHTIVHDHLIVLDPHGIRYVNQVGGTICAQPWAQGYVIPLYTSLHREGLHLGDLLDLWIKFFDGFGSPEKYEQLTKAAAPLLDPEDGYYRKLLRIATLEEIRNHDQSSADQLLKHSSFGEAWLPVVIREDAAAVGPLPVLSTNVPSLQGRMAILTWENSD